MSMLHNRKGEMDDGVYEEEKRKTLRRKRIRSIKSIRRS